MLWVIYCNDRVDTASLRDQYLRYLDQRKSIPVLAGATACAPAGITDALPKGRRV
jgi:hypothetical protein